MNVRHSGNAGDVIFAIPTVISLAVKQDGPIDFFLQTGIKAEYYRGAIHPAGDVRLTEGLANALIPLLESQEWCRSAKIYNNEPIDVDLDLFRLVPGIQHGSLARHYFYAFDAWYDLSQPWLWVTPLPGLQDRLVVARTSRYRSNLRYQFLDSFKPIFVGLEEEYMEFRRDVPSAEWLRTSNFLEVAQVIAGCKAFVSNQCCAFAIAEGLKVPRCLETCPFARNVMPVGGNCRDALNQMGFEKNIRDLMEVA